MSLTFTQLQQKLRVVMSLIADLNDMEKTVSRLKDELKKEYDELDARLNGDKP